MYCCCRSNYHRGRVRISPLTGLVPTLWLSHTRTWIIDRLSPNVVAVSYQDLDLTIDRLSPNVVAVSYQDLDLTIDRLSPNVVAVAYQDLDY
jgi:hypothetical protein